MTGGKFPNAGVPCPGHTRGATLLPQLYLCPSGKGVPVIFQDPQKLAPPWSAPPIFMAVSYISEGTFPYPPSGDALSSLEEAPTEKVTQQVLSFLKSMSCVNESNTFFTHTNRAAGIKSASKVE